MQKLKLCAVAGALLSSLVISQASAAPYYSGALPVHGDGWNDAMLIYEKYYNKTPTSNMGGFRIPSITTTSQGSVIAAVDKRFNGISGNTDIFGNGKVQKVYISVKTSFDGGSTWTYNKFLIPNADTYIEGQTEDYTHYISDPAIVHNPKSGSTFVIGYQNDSGLLNTPTSNWSMWMWESKDGGRSWDKGRKIAGGNLPNSAITLGPGYDKALQGPGSGMYYNGAMYVAIQQWGGDKSLTSGFIYSTDNGKTWKQSSLIIPDGSTIGADGFGANGEEISSESNIFHHKGAIYLAAKYDPTAQAQGKMRRLLWKTYDQGQTWINAWEEESSFIPGDIAKCETSSFALTDNIYFVGYTTEQNVFDRDNTYLTTNTGRKILLGHFEKGMGYTSISADLDNVYVLFEGAADANNNKADGGGILFRRFDYAGKDYANINGRLFESGKDLRYIQTAIMNNDSSYARAAYGDNEDIGAEMLFNYEKAKLGIFYKSANDQSEDVYRTVPYKEDTVSITLGTNNLITDSTDWFHDSFYIGYQYSNVDFNNGASDDVNSIIGGAAFRFITPWVNYDLKVTGMHSTHDFQRNSNEGLNKSAEFDSSVISITNELSRIFDITANKTLSIRPFIGVDSTYIKHDGFSEQNGNYFNDITVDSSSNWSHGGYIGLQAYGSYMLPKGMSLDYDAKVRYIHEFGDIDDWTDTYTVFDDKFAFASPVNKDDYEDAIEGIASVKLNINDRFSVGVAGKVDTATDNSAVFGQFSFNF